MNAEHQEKGGRRRSVHTLSSSVICENKSDTRKLFERIKRNSKVHCSPHPLFSTYIDKFFVEQINTCVCVTMKFQIKKNIHLICKLEFQYSPCRPCVVYLHLLYSRIPIQLALWPFVTRCSLKFHIQTKPNTLSCLVSYIICILSICLSFFSFLALITIW